MHLDPWAENGADIESLPLGTDYLGDLNGKLRDLRGFSTLAHELIQNADDAPNATSIIFDMHDDVLLVENNGVFSDCGHVQENECPWSTDASIGHYCDFHRFRKTASGDKRREVNTTGAFGIGFISVYQITDRPELISNGRQWFIDPTRPEADRIRQIRRATPPGTQFRLPLAFDPNSMARKSLGVAAVTQDDVEQFVKELAEALPDSAVFLRKLEHLELRRQGTTVMTIRRSAEDDRRLILVQDVRSGVDIIHEWYVFEGDFSPAAERIRRTAPNQIGIKQTPKVEIALLKLGAGFIGRFHAFLPTQQPTGMPFHINADFFPASNRKGIFFERDFQGEWNRAAVRAAAELLASRVLQLRSYLTPGSFWNVINQARRVWDDRRSVASGDELDAFWERLKQTLPNEAVVYTTQHQWLRPSQVKLLQSESDERNCIPLLERMGLHIVSPELNRYQTLLREVGVSYLDAARLAQELRSSNLVGELAQTDLPPWIQSEHDRNLLAEEIAILVGRNQRAKDEFADIAIVRRSDGIFTGPRSLRRADADTQETFGILESTTHFASDNNPQPISDLVQEFTLDDAVNLIYNFPVERLAEIWHNDSTAYLFLLSWFAQRRSLVGPYAERLRQLTIWPAAGQLHPLTTLVMPGDFEDPLGLADVLDGQVVEQCRELLRVELGVQALTLATYLRDYVPLYFANDRPKEADSYRRLIRLLAENIGKIRDDELIRSKLAATALVVCTDGKLRIPNEVYLDSPVVRDILGSDVNFAKDLSQWAPSSYREVYTWLGVREHPHPVHVAKRIKKIVAAPPNGEVRAKIQRIFEYLATIWVKGDAHLENSFRDLVHLPWLPAEDDMAHWHIPSTLYSAFQKYLFSTQAKFLDIPFAVQSRAGALFAFFDVQTVPRTLQIVRHLLRAVEEPFDVNKQVYVVLDQRADEPEIKQLAGQRCLLLENHGYIDPSKVFWNEHYLGAYRYRLSDDFRAYAALLKRLNVKESPDVGDAAAVLKEIAADFAESHRPLDDEAEQVLVKCWRMIAEAILTDSNDTRLGNLLEELAGYSIIPDVRRVLRRPAELYFADRPRLAEQLGDYLRYEVIPRPQDIWQAMERAGVQPLSRAVRIELVECEHPQPAPNLQERITHRRVLILRVLEAQRTALWDRTVLDKVTVTRAEHLRLRYMLPGLANRVPAPVDDVTGYFETATSSLYYVGDESNMPWSAMARELAYALSPDSDAGQIAPGLRVVLSATSAAQAESELDEMGFAALQSTEGIGVALGQTANPGGVSDDFDEQPPPENIGREQSRTDPDAGTGDGGGLGGEDDSSDTASNGTRGGGAPKHDGPDTDRKPGEQASNSAPGRDNQRDKPKRQSGRFRTYVTSKVPDAKPADNNASQERSKVDRAGVDKVLAFEKMAGRTASELPHTHPGYDVESYDHNGELVRLIEVKSMPDLWGDLGAGLTETQFEKAQQEGDRYWLYIVERAVNEDGRIIRIQNPAGKVTQFLYDDGWRDVAEPDDPKPMYRRSILDLKSSTSQPGE